MISGGDGNDLIDGGGGDDTIDGGDGEDTIDGGAGDDVIEGGAQDDSLLGGDGDDTLRGQGGNDTLDGGAGNDSVSGSANDDLLFGGDGNDDVTGSGGNDTLDGGAGDDTVRGGRGDDSLDGGDGDDFIRGDTPGDTIPGLDTIDGGAGNDTIQSGPGADEVVGGLDDDLILGASSGDVIDGSSGTSDDPNGTDDFDTLDLTGSGVDFITYTSPDQEDGIITFNDGTTATFQEIENVIPCFTPGTLIATPKGEVPVEELKVGDRIITRDNGVQPIEWVGARGFSGQDMAEDPKLKPVMIRKGALGHGLPERDMMVSPNHRMLICTDDTRLLFDEPEVLVAAKHLIGQPGINTVDMGSTSYIHVMFERHQVILGDGSWTESFQPGQQTLGGFQDEQREEIFKLFPELRDAKGQQAYGAARKSLKSFEAKVLRKQA